MLDLQRSSFGQVIRAAIAEDQEHLTALRKAVKGGENPLLATVHVQDVLLGARNTPTGLVDTSRVHPTEGLTIRGIGMGEIGKPSNHTSDVFYLLLTGRWPDAAESTEFSCELRSRAEVPDYVWNVVRAVPKTVHPMDQLCIGIQTMSAESVFEKGRTSVAPADLWELALEDGLNIVGCITQLAAGIYRRTYRNDDSVPELMEDGSYGRNFARMLGAAGRGREREFAEYMGLYLKLHSDHGGRNASAHVADITSSTHASLYGAVPAGLSALKGPLHGAANVNALKWLRAMREKLGDSPDEEEILGYAREFLATGKKIPGMGHGVLRDIDVRFLSQETFGLQHFPSDPRFQTMLAAKRACSKALEEQGKTNNPNPNVDFASGTILEHFGMTEADFYVVLFGVARTLGFVAQAVWARARGLPINRPYAITLGEAEDPERYFERTGIRPA